MLPYLQLELCLTFLREQSDFGLVHAYRAGLQSTISLMDNTPGADETRCKVDLGCNPTTTFFFFLFFCHTGSDSGTQIPCRLGTHHH